MRKINTNLMMIQMIFCLVVVGGSILCFNTICPTYFRHYRINIAKEVFDVLRENDISKINKWKKELEEYENYNYTITIADENMKPVYRTKEIEKKTSVRQNIELEIENFTSEPVVIQRKVNNKTSVRVIGIITQGNEKYYVSVRDKIKSIDTTMKFTVTLLLCIFVVAVGIGSFAMYLMAKRMMLPIARLEQVAKKIARRDFSDKAEENGKFVELNNLGASINSMSEQIHEYVDNIEKNKERILKQNLEQQRLDKVRKDMVANISHELKTPLAVISSQVEMLQYIKNEEKKEEYYLSIQEEVARMTDMVGNLLDMSKLEKDYVELKWNRFSMDEVMLYIMMKYDSLLRKKKIQVSTEFAQNCFVYGDREYVEQAISNYMMNALQHTQNGKQISVTMEKHGEYLRVSVYNEGKNIPEEEKELIWKSFYVPQGEEEEQNQGQMVNHTGLGLYIVKTTIEKHRGRYGVENKENGVEFWFEIPMSISTDGKENSGSYQSM